jgi:hypothetical protein
MQTTEQSAAVAELRELFMSEWRGDNGPNREAILFNPHF